MSALLEISEKFIKVAEEYLPELAGRIAIFGQGWQEPKDGKPYVIVSLEDGELANFTDSAAGQDEWARTFHITLHVYGRDLDTISVAEKLTFLADRTANQNKFFANGIGVFSNRKIKPRPEYAGSTPVHRYDIDFALKFIGRSDPSRYDFEAMGEIAALTTER